MTPDESMIVEARDLKNGTSIFDLGSHFRLLTRSHFPNKRHRPGLNHRRRPPPAGCPARTVITSNGPQVTGGQVVCFSLDVREETPNVAAPEAPCWCPAHGLVAANEGQSESLQSATVR